MMRNFRRSSFDWRGGGSAKHGDCSRGPKPSGSTDRCPVSGGLQPSHGAAVGLKKIEPRMSGISAKTTLHSAREFRRAFAVLRSNVSRLSSGTQAARPGIARTAPSFFAPPATELVRPRRSIRPMCICRHSARGSLASKGPATAHQSVRDGRCTHDVRCSFCNRIVLIKAVPSEARSAPLRCWPIAGGCGRSGP
jgi:hypothetical protein